MSNFVRQSNAVNEPQVYRTVARPTGPMIASNDLAALVAIAVMMLGPLAAAAFWVH